MKRWLIILSIVMANAPDLAVAATKPAAPTLWQRLVAILTPKSATPPTRAVFNKPRANRATALASAAPLAATAAPKLSATEPPRAAADGCNGRQRIISAYYWEGRHTASGAPFDPHAMTAAHRTLPFGTQLNVTNPHTGKSVVVVINDRGPFVRGVSLDLSLAAAQAIGMRGTGVVCIP